MPATPVCAIDATGIHKPVYADCLSYFQNAYRAIYGQDTYLEADAQDGQFIGILALALDDTNAEAVATYNSFSPSTAQGAGLSSVVKINGIARKTPTRSSVDVVVVGQTGTVITNGIAVGKHNWLLPATVTIPYSGQVTVTAVAEELGAIVEEAGAINQIGTPTLGWQSVTNPAVPSVGAPIEKDAALRIRQAISTMLPAASVLDGLQGAVAAVAGVQSVTSYENKGNVPDVNGIPGHCISLVVTGGDSTEIGRVIELKKGPGVNTYGSTVVALPTKFGFSRSVAFFRPATVQIRFVVTLIPLSGYTVDVENDIKNSLSDWVNGLGDGRKIRISRAGVAANQNRDDEALPYEVVTVAAARGAFTPTPADVTIAFNERSACSPANVSIVITS